VEPTIRTITQFGYLMRSACPCCFAPLTRATPAVASDPPGESLPPERHGAFMSGYGARRVFFTYHRCAACGALYCPVFYTLEQLEKLYGCQVENMAEVPLAARQRTQDGYADLLMKHCRRGGSFLEIGADIGLFAARCAKLGSFEHMWLFEPNRNVHAELDARLGNQPHSVHVEMWPTDAVTPGSVSTAALIHVLDHLIDPAAFLGLLRDKLEDGGIALLVTHNIDSLLAHALGRRFPPFALQHPQLYSPSSITQLLSGAGFTIIEIRAVINHFPLMHLVHAGLSILGLPTPIPNVHGPLIPVKLGNMAVLARRAGS
jgi:2-polyprenyl-3-methyl-5-hydroxy-6-metoxy-1,4-benzoquinol methylase